MTADTFSLIDRAINTAVNIGKLANAPSSTLFDSSKHYRVEPYFLIEENLRETEYVKQLVPHLLTVFIASYTHTASILGNNAVRAEHIRFLDSINPDRSYYGTESDAQIPAALDASAYNYGLPEIGKKQSRVELENSGGSNTASTTVIPNLTVGREVLVSLGNGDQQQSHPVVFRAIPMAAGRRSLVNWFSTLVTGTGIIERWNAVADGKISFISDFIFCRDMVLEYKKSALATQDKSLEKVKARRNKSIAASLVNRRLPLAAASSFYIISRQTAEDIEIETGINFDRAGKRDAYFEKGAAQGIVVVDEDRGLVKVYYKGIPAVAELTLSELKSSNRNSMSDELLAAVIASLRATGNPSAF